MSTPAPDSEAYIVPMFLLWLSSLAPYSGYGTSQFEFQDPLQPWTVYPTNFSSVTLGPAQHVSFAGPVYL